MIFIILSFLILFFEIQSLFLDTFSQIAKHLIRLLIKTFPDLVSIYPEKDKEKTELVKSIDYRLNKLQEYLFFGQKQYCLPELLKMLEMKEDQMVSLESENPNLTLDKILLFTFKS